MTHIVRRRRARFEIRESLATPRGPRSRLLASFREPLTPDVIERAAARATRRFDRGALVRRARAAGIAVAPRRREPEVRALLARLHRPDPLDPALAALLRQKLGERPQTELPEALAEVAEWVGAGAEKRGAALRELLDLYGRIADSRPPPRQRQRRRFPRFSSLRRAG
jgi:hypothetical protein